MPRPIKKQFSPISPAAVDSFITRRAIHGKLQYWATGRLAERIQRENGIEWGEALTLAREAMERKGGK